MFFYSVITESSGCSHRKKKRRAQCEIYFLQTTHRVEDSAQLLGLAGDSDMNYWFLFALLDISGPPSASTSINVHRKEHLTSTQPEQLDINSAMLALSHSFIMLRLGDIE